MAEPFLDEYAWNTLLLFMTKSVLPTRLMSTCPSCCMLKVSNDLSLDFQKKVFKDVLYLSTDED